MGDYYQVVVDRDIPLDQADEVASAIRQCLIVENVIEPQLTDCTLGNGGYAPGKKCALAFDGTSDEVTQLRTNGLQIIIGRSIFYSSGADLICDRCNNRTFEGDAFSEAFGGWSAGQDGCPFKCPNCGHAKPVADCTFDPPWGFGNLGFKFWNWPPLKKSFVGEVSRRLGHRIVFVCGKA